MTMRKGYHYKRENEHGGMKEKQKIVGGSK
jgi:hypothetical protein